MDKFHLPPNDPRIMNMTLEQRNFCILNMNQDGMLREGKTGDVASDTTADKWLNAPEKDFHVIPKGLDPKRVIKNIQKKVGLPELELDNTIWQNVKKKAPLKHAYRVGRDKKYENEANQALMRKAKLYKKKGIDKSSYWDKMLGKKNQHFNI